MERFLQRLVREAAIETGIIERLYTLDRGVTQALIEHGLNEALIPHQATGRPSGQVMALIRDQNETIEGLFDFVADRRTLSISYIRELHQQLTRHQETTDGMTPDGRYVQIPLLRGEWKRFPNNPTRPDGTVHAYAPPVQVASEMDRLIAFFLEQQRADVAPEVQAAWLHHRFTQIHPFQDGNGRIARLLVSLVFIQTKLFPLVLTGEERMTYISALEDADYGDLGALVHLFVSKQKRAFLQAIGISESVLSEHRRTSEIIQSVASQIQASKKEAYDAHRQQVEQFAKMLFARLEKRINGLKEELHAQLPELDVQMRTAPHGTPRAVEFHRNPVHYAARRYKYFANTEAYSAWLWLRLTGSEYTEVLFSFHAPGEWPRGVLVCTGVVYRQEKHPEGFLDLREREVLSEEPFSFSYASHPETLPGRFEEWLEGAIVSALSYWQRQGV